MKTLFYFGETKDFSDRWLLAFLKRYYKIILMEPEKKNLARFSEYPDLVINRLYTSSVNRHGEKKIQKLIDIIRELEQKHIPIINSSKGYLLDLDRKKQFEYFSSRGFPFAQISKVNSILFKRESIHFPCVLKFNPSGRNKTLPIIRDREELLKLPNLTIQRSTLQPLIKNGLCYRTEFVTKWYSTFTQFIDFQEKSLKFFYTKKIAPTPLSRLFKEKLLKIMKEIGVQVFSIEYFIKNNKTPIIVDFNLTSNYPCFFIEKAEEQLKGAWLNLIKNEIL